MVRGKTAAGVLLVAWLAALIIGCKGEQGPAGEDAVGVDTAPPLVILLSPQQGDTIRNSLIVRVQAIDNGLMDRVVFYLDGSDQAYFLQPSEEGLVDSTIDSTTAQALSEPYEYHFRPPLHRWEIGPHTVAARAYDQAGNSALTPTIIVEYLGPLETGEITLSNYDPYNEATTVWPIYDFYTIERDTTILVDDVEVDTTLEVNVGVRYFSRFVPEDSCVLKSVRVYLDSLPGEDMASSDSLRFSIYRSNGAYPVGDSLAAYSRLIPDTSAIGWYEMVFPPGVEVAFSRGEQFHVLVNAYAPADTTRMAVRADPRPMKTLALENRSGFWDTIEERWMTFQEKYGFQYGAYEFWIEAVVEYRSGATAVLTPGTNASPER